MFNPINKLASSLSLQLFVRKLRSQNTQKEVWTNSSSISIEDALRLDLLKDMYQSDSHNYSDTTALNDRSHGDLFETLRNMFVQKVLNTTIDVQEITGLGASKSNLKECHSIDDFVRENCSHLIEVSEQSFLENFNHQEIEILHLPVTTDHLVMYGWDSKLYLNNKAGSHHFAAMRHIASRMNKQVPITGKIELTYLDENVVKQFNQNYKCYLFNKDNEKKLKDLSEFNNLPCLFFFNGRYLTNTGLLMFRKRDWHLFGFEEKALSSVLTDFNAELERFCCIQQSNQQFQDYLSR